LFSLAEHVPHAHGVPILVSRRGLAQGSPAVEAECQGHD
jgi:hypothetical protein